MRKHYYLLILIVFSSCKKDELKTNSNACFDFSPNSNIKVGDTLIFSNCSENATKYFWDFGDGNISNEKLPIHSYDNYGNFDILLSVSNENNSDTLLKTVTINPKPDNIIYHLATNDQKINTVRFFTPSMVPPNIQNCPSIPTPQDSSTSMTIDLNGDSIEDFLIEAEHGGLTFGCGSHCVCSYYRISIISQNSNSWISSQLKNNMDYIPISYDSLYVINKDTIWKDHALLLLDNPSAPFSTSFTKSYVGIKINDCYGWIKIEPLKGNGIKIIDYAINLTKKNEIKAGQQK